MRITIIISSNEPETVRNAFRFANTSLIYENEVCFSCWARES